jgi:APA family basic amino acid/polyamine antiporter
VKRKLGAFDAAMIVSGAIIGSGIFINSAESAKFLQTSSQLLLVSMGPRRLPGRALLRRTGSHVSRTGDRSSTWKLSPWVGFLFGWTLFSTIQTGAIAAVAYTCASFVGVFLPSGRGGTVALAVAIIWLLSLVNFLGIRPGSIVQNVFTPLKIAALLVLIGYGLFWQRPGVLEWGALFPQGLNLGLLSAFGLALMPALFSYGGWQNLNFVAGEVKNPARSIPLAIISGVALVVLVYVCSNVVYIKALPIGEIAASNRLASDAMRTMAGPLGASFISLAIIISTFGITNVFIMTGPRVYYVMARERMFLPVASCLHRRYGTPHYSILLQSLWASALLLTNSYGRLLQYVTFGDWIFFGRSPRPAGFRRRARPSNDLYRTWGYPLVPLVFLAVSVAVVLNVIISSPLKSAAGSAIILGGLPIYVFFRRKERTKRP